MMAIAPRTIVHLRRTAGVLIVMAVLVLLNAQQWHLGVVPRDPSGLIGVLLAPLIHAGWAHWASNALPLLLLLPLAFGLYPKTAPWALGLVWLGSGVCVWALGRHSQHVGASGLVYGLWAFVLAMAVRRRDREALAGAALVLLALSGISVGLWPTNDGSSWESHLSAAVMGALSAALWGRLDPPPAPWVWEEEPETKVEPSLEDLEP